MCCDIYGRFHCWTEHLLVESVAQGAPVFHDVEVYTLVGCNMRRKYVYDTDVQLVLVLCYDWLQVVIVVYYWLT